MRWEAAPKPRLNKLLIKKIIYQKGISEEERYKKIEERDMILTENEPSI